MWNVRLIPRDASVVVVDLRPIVGIVLRLVLQAVNPRRGRLPLEPGFGVRLLARAGDPAPADFAGEEAVDPAERAFASVACVWDLDVPALGGREMEEVLDHSNFLLTI
jgi:hypothetical protein